MTDSNNYAMSEADMLRLATRRADAKLGFQRHAFIYVLVIAGLAGVNLLTTPAWPWFLFPLGGWGIGLAAHGLAVHGDLSGRRQAMIERELARLRR